MPIQTTYPFDYTKALQGMPYDLTPSVDVTGDAAVDIEFGLGLVLDSSRTPLNNRLAVKLPDGSGNVFAGVALYSRSQVNSGTEGGFGDLTVTAGTLYQATDPIRLRRQGRVYVYSEQAVAPGDPVFLRYTANGAGTAVGQFRKDADTSRAIQLTNAQWVGTIAAAGIVVLELNAP